MRSWRQGPPSLVGRLIAWQALALLVAWLALGLLITWQTLLRSDRDISQRLIDTARLLVETASREPANAGGHVEEAYAAWSRQMGRDVLGEAGWIRFQVVDANAQVLHRSRPEQGQAEAPPITWPDALGAGTNVASAALKSGGWWVVTAWSADGRVALQMAEPDRLPLRALLHVWWLVLQSQVMVFLWHGLVVWVTVRSGLAPLRQLAERIRRRRSGDVAPIRVDKVYAETAPVLHELNALLAHEAQRLASERRFLADAAHELRTPLAAVSSQAHQLLAEPEDAARRQAAQGLQLGIRRVSHLLTQLLTLARADAALTALPIRSDEAIDVVDLVRCRVALLAPQARKRGVEMGFTAPDALTCVLDTEALCSLVDNLVDNAIRYNRFGGHVEVSLSCVEGSSPSASGPCAVLCVQDDGTGIPEACRERVWERFYRVPGTTQTGTGLGLAIVQRVAQHMGATLTLVDGLHGKGVGVRCEWPFHTVPYAVQSAY